MSFESIRHNGVNLMVYGPWWREGIVHGMTMAPLDFSASGWGESWKTLSGALPATHLAFPAQHHGTSAWDLRDERTIDGLLELYPDLVRRVPGDAVVTSARQGIAERTTVYGVVTADCIPVLLRSAGGWAAVHAGWRGLAGGVVDEAIRLLGSPEGAEAVIFPCAGASSYEVGEEVVEALGQDAVHAPSGPSKHLLNLEATVTNRLRRCLPDCQVAGASICTIRDSRFHSHRRDGERAGRALSFVVPPR